MRKLLFLSCALMGALVAIASPSPAPASPPAPATNNRADLNPEVSVDPIQQTLAGEPLVLKLAETIKLRNSNSATIQAREHEIAAADRQNEVRRAEIARLVAQNDQLAPQIAGMSAAMQAGTPYPPPAA